jgi:hypothetical protein
MVSTMSAVILCPLIAAELIHVNDVARRSAALHRERLEARVALAAQLMARHLDHLAGEVEALAEGIELGDRASLERSLMTMIRSRPQYGWIGIVDPAGRILASTNDTLKGEVTRESDWFREGQKRPYASAFGRGHARATGPATPALITFAAPIRVEEWTVGVLGASLDTGWLRRMLSTVMGEGTDPLLVDARGRVLLGPSDIEGRLLASAVAQAARRGRTASRLEIWRDGNDYLLAAAPGVRFANADVPGWSLVGRERVAGSFPTTDVFHSFWIVFGTAIAIVLAGLAAVSHHLAKPFGAIAAFAAQLADGTPSEVPPTASSTLEAFQLSAAVARLQSRLQSAEREAARRRPVAVSRATPAASIPLQRQGAISR